MIHYDHHVSGGDSHSVSGGDSRSVSGGDSRSVSGGDSRSVSGGDSRSVSGGDSRSILGKSHAYQDLPGVLTPLDGGREAGSPTNQLRTNSTCHPHSSTALYSCGYRNHTSDQ